MTTHRAFTGFPQVRQSLPHFAPVLGAMTIPGINRMPTSTTTMPHQSSDQTVVPDAVLDAMQAQTTPLAPAGPAPAPVPEVLLGIGTAGISGAITGGIAASSWRGAAIGAGVNAGLWSGFTLLGGWNGLSKGSRVALGLTTGVGLAAAAALAFSR